MAVECPDRGVDGGEAVRGVGVCRVWAGFDSVGDGNIMV